MSLIGIHESCQGSEIISIRAKRQIASKKIFQNGLGPDDVVILQKKEGKGSKNKTPEDKKGSAIYNLFSFKRKLFPNNNKEENKEEKEPNKSENLFPINDSTILYSHSPGGFFLNSQASFPAYFSELLRISASPNKRTFWQTIFGNDNSNNNYDDNFVSKGCYYSYNIFTHKDIIVSVDNPGGCQTMMMNDKGQLEKNLTNEDWRQVCLSSKLRFYRCSQPLLTSFMFSRPIQTVCYYIYEVPYMNNSDFEYCMDNYEKEELNDDFEMSIAMSLIVNCDLKYVLEFIEKYDKKFPRVLLHVIKHISPSSNFCKMLIPILINHMKNFSDDIEVATVFFNIAMNNNRLDICTSLLMPILQGSIWATPFCSVSFASFCIKNNLFESAFEYLNLAAVVNAKNQKKNEVGYLSNLSNLLSNIPRSKSLNESNLSSYSQQNLLRSTSMTLSLKEKKEEMRQISTDPNLKVNKFSGNNECECEFENNMDNYFCNSLSSSSGSPQNSRKNSFYEESPSIFANKRKSYRNNSFTESKKEQNNFGFIDFESFLPHSLTKKYCIDESSDNQHKNYDYDSFSSSKMSSGQSSRKNSCNENINVLENDKDLSNFYFKSKPYMTNPNESLEYGPSNNTLILLENQFVSLKSQILFTLSDLIEKLGEADFVEKKNNFIGERPMADEEEFLYDEYSDVYASCCDQNDSESVSNKCPNGFCTDLDVADNENYDYNGNSESANEVLVSEESSLNPSQVENQIESDHSDVHSGCGKERLNKEYCAKNTKNISIALDDLPDDALFDPGIDSRLDSVTILPNEINCMMPISNFFKECLSEISQHYAESMLILAHQKDVTTSTQTSTLFISLATKDKRLMEAMLNSFSEENKATGTDKLILLRGFTLGVTSNLEAILTVPLEPLTVIEKNALAFMEPFAIGIHRLNNTEI